MDYAHIWSHRFLRPDIHLDQQLTLFGGIVSVLSVFGIGTSCLYQVIFICCKYIVVMKF